MNFTFLFVDDLQQRRLCSLQFVLWVGGSCANKQHLIRRSSLSLALGRHDFPPAAGAVVCDGGL